MSIPIEYNHVILHDIQLIALKMAICPWSYNVLIEISVCVMSGNKCAFLASGGKWYVNRAVCVDLISEPSGNITVMPSFLQFLSTYLLFICKKWNIVP